VARKVIRQVLVVGLGKFGLTVAAELTRLGHEVLAVDVDPRAVQEASGVATQALEVDANDEAALRALGVADFDIAVVAINDPARAILATFILRDLGVPSIVARAQSPTEVRILERAGNTRAVLVEQAMGRYVARSIGIGNAVDVLPVSDDVVIVRVHYREGLPERTVAELERLRSGVTVIAVRRSADVIVTPDPGTRVRPGDDLVLVGRQADLEALRLPPA
jgi:trk system potassium uptake protein